MAHTPDYPARFVCTNCRVADVGTAVQREDDDTIWPPDAQDACEVSEFV